MKRKISELLPKLWYWKKASWTRSQWLCYDRMKPLLKYKDNDEFRAVGKRPCADNVIWMYWRQGEANAPEIVRRCISSVRRHSGGRRVMVLDASTLGDYLAMPDFIERKHADGKIGEALYSDLLRVSLLLEYGGIWCDATCYMTRPIDSVVERAPFFMFTKSLLFADTTPIDCSSWFIKAEKGNAALRKLRNVLFHYFSRHSWLPDYYIFHITLGLLVRTDSEVEALWQSKPYICNMNPHVFLFSFQMPYSESRYRHILDSCFIHKLTYKYDPQLPDAEPENMLRHFLNNNDCES